MSCVQCQQAGLLFTCPFTAVHTLPFLIFTHRPFSWSHIALLALHTVVSLKSVHTIFPVYIWTFLLFTHCPAWCSCLTISHIHTAFFAVHTLPFFCSPIAISEVHILPFLLSTRGNFWCSHIALCDGSKWFGLPLTSVSEWCSHIVWFVVLVATHRWFLLFFTHGSVCCLQKVFSVIKHGLVWCFLLFTYGPDVYIRLLYCITDTVLRHVCVWHLLL